MKIWHQLQYSRLKFLGPILSFAGQARGLPYVLLLVFSIPADAQDQSTSITVESSTMQPSVALGRPMLTWWDVKVPSTSLVVGKFEFVIKHDEQVLATVLSDEFTLNGPAQRIRVELPVIESSTEIDQLQVDITFLGKKGREKLKPTQILRVPFRQKKVAVALLGESRIVKKRTPQRDRMKDLLKFENIIPGATNSENNDLIEEKIKSFFATLDPSDFPSEPLAYCSYELVVLLGDDFRSLRAPQLEALLAWVKAGGSLYVEPNGVLESAQVDFLRNLVANDPRETVIQLNSEGKIPRESILVDEPALIFPCGVGSAAIRLEEPDGEFHVTPEAWSQIVRPLWRSRANPVASQLPDVQGVRPDGLPKLAFTHPDPWGLAYVHINRFRLVQKELLERIMPEGVRMVPLSLLASILFVFVLMIGPGDYFVLGWLRLRKLTWITFPLATLAVTVLTVSLSNAFMSAAESRRAVVVNDLGYSNDVVRTNRFELLYISSTRRVPTEVEKGFFSELKTSSEFADFVTAANGQRYTVMNGQLVPLNSYGAVGNERPNNVTTQFQGRIPSQYVVMQDLAKWTPQLNRIFSIPGTPLKPVVDWTEFQLNQQGLDLIQKHAIPTKFMELAQKQFGPKAMVACFTGNDGWAYDRSEGWSLKRASTQSVPINQGMPQRYDPYGNVNPIGTDVTGVSRAQNESGLFRWIYQASVAPPVPGTYSFTKQTAPNGSASCDDLPVLDSTNPHEWLLVIVVPGVDDTIVYRKLMRL